MDIFSVCRHSRNHRHGDDRHHDGDHDRHSNLRADDRGRDDGGGDDGRHNRNHDLLHRYHGRGRHNNRLLGVNDRVRFLPMSPHGYPLRPR